MSTVLLAVHDNRLCRLLYNLLDMKNYRVITASSIGQAKALLEKESGIDRIACSEEMSDGSGLAFLTDLRSAPDTTDIKRMLLGPETEEKGLRAAAEAIGAAYLPGTTDFISTIAAFLE